MKLEQDTFVEKTFYKLQAHFQEKDSSFVHPTEEMMELLLNQWLDIEAEEELLQHLITCRDCRKQYEKKARLFSCERNGYVESNQEDMLRSNQEKSSIFLWPGRLFAAAACFFLLFALYQGWQELEKKKYGYTMKGARETWTKGIDTSAPNFFSKASLYIGVSDAPGRTVRRIRKETACRKKQSLFFGFSLPTRSGYVYLFRSSTNEDTSELIFSTAGRVFRTSRNKIFLVKRNGLVQRYPLEKEHGSVSFLLVYSKKWLVEELVFLSSNSFVSKKTRQKLKRLGQNKELSLDFFRIRIEK